MRKATKIIFMAGMAIISASLFQNCTNNQMDSRKACDDGDVKKCNAVGEMYLNGTGVEKDTKTAGKYFQKACDGGDARGCFNLSEMYNKGSGVESDPKKACELLHKACDGGFMQGCFVLGLNYSIGRGVELDPKKAEELVQKACDSRELSEWCRKMRKSFH